MPQSTSADGLLKKAFELAYFILGDRAASIYVAMAAIDKLKAASTNQDRRLYYTPTGRPDYRAARTKINLSEIHLLQRLVYIESELFERLLEGQEDELQQEDLIIRYIKHLVRITTKHNSFYVTLGLSRLLYNYGTAETSEIYNLVLQDPERMRDDYYYRSRKKRLMQEMKDRFGPLISTQRGFRREERFEAQEDSQQYADLVRECLNRFTPWQSSCVLPKDLDPDRNAITGLLFEGEDPDQEHRVELNRIHTLIHPECFDRVAAALNLQSAESRLELPYFSIPGGGPVPRGDRFNPRELSASELVAIRRYLDKNASHRKNYSEGQLSLLIDGHRWADFEFDDSSSAAFEIADGSEFIEIRSAGSVESDETCLAACLLTYDQSGLVPLNSSIVLGKGHRLSLAVSSSTDDSSEGRVAELSIVYQRTTPASAMFRALQQFGSRLSDWMLFSPRPPLHLLKPALILLMLALGGIGFWLYYRAGRVAAPLPQIAKLDEDHKSEPSSFAPPATPPQSHTNPDASRNGIQQPKRTGQDRAKGATGIGDQSTEIEGTRGTNPKPRSAMLLAVKRVYVDSLGDDLFSRQLREELTGTLRTSTRFAVVDNRDDADAVFKGMVKQSTKDRATSVDLDLVNASGEVVWSLSSHNNERALRADARNASAMILKLLLRDIKLLEFRR